MILTLAGLGGLAAVLPLRAPRPLAGGRPPGRGAWSVGPDGVHGRLGDLLAGTAALEQARGAVAGAILGALVGGGRVPDLTPGRGLAGPARHHLIGLPWRTE